MMLLLKGTSGPLLASDPHFLDCVQCESEDSQFEVGTLPGFMGSDVDNSIFPVTAGALDNLKTAEIDE